jgi:hypothetical protein
MFISDEMILKYYKMNNNDIFNRLLNNRNNEKKYITYFTKYNK